jgi:hypothetical protein
MECQVVRVSCCKPRQQVSAQVTKLQNKSCNTLQACEYCIAPAKARTTGFVIVLWSVCSQE